MRTPSSLLAALATLVLAASACGDDGSSVAADPAPTSASSSGPPAAVPPGPVRTADLATVMDTGSPELCLGPVAESYPPQCSGPPLLGWDWAEHDGMYDEQGAVRWGTFVVTGTWDGTSFTATDAVPGALYDPAMPTPTPTPTPDATYSDAELAGIVDDLRSAPGVLGTAPLDGGHVLADVTYDDGTLQDWADETYGAGVVLVEADLVDAD